MQFDMTTLAPWECTVVRSDGTLAGIAKPSLAQLGELQARLRQAGEAETAHEAEEAEQALRAYLAGLGGADWSGQDYDELIAAAGFVAAYARGFVEGKARAAREAASMPRGGRATTEASGSTS